MHPFRIVDVRPAFLVGKSVFFFPTKSFGGEICGRRAEGPRLPITTKTATVVPKHASSYWPLLNHSTCAIASLYHYFVFITVWCLSPLYYYECHKHVYISHNMFTAYVHMQTTYQNQKGIFHFSPPSSYFSTSFPHQKIPVRRSAWVLQMFRLGRSAFRTANLARSLCTFSSVRKPLLQSSGSQIIQSQPLRKTRPANPLSLVTCRSRMFSTLALSELTAISAIDGRYATATLPLRHIFSEYGLIRQRGIEKICLFVSQW